MPTVVVNNTELHYEEAGRGAETIVFSHGLLMSSDSYREQLREFSRDYRVIAYDHRGHGRSAVPTDGYDMDTLAEDAAELIRHVGAPVHFAGLSMGGFVGLRLAARRPELLRSIILMATSADAQAGDVKGAKGVATGIVRRFGLSAIAPIAVKTMYGAPYLADKARHATAVSYVKKLPSSMWRPMMAVVDRPSIASELPRIAIPALVLVGESDTLLPPENSERIAAAIPGSKFVRIPKTGHLITDENPDAANAAIRSFLSSIPSKKRPVKAVSTAPNLLPVAAVPVAAAPVSREAVSRGLYPAIALYVVLVSAVVASFYARPIFDHAPRNFWIPYAIASAL